VSKLTIRQQEIQRLEELLEFYRTHRTMKELAERYGVSHSTVDKWRTLHSDFPKPSERRISSSGFKGAPTIRRTQEVDDWISVKRFDNPNFGKSRKRAK